MLSFSVFSPDGKKFRSRNELRSYFVQTGSSLSSEDFDFSVKGKGHHNKGKTPVKTNDEAPVEPVKESVASRRVVTPAKVESPPQRESPKTSIGSSERPKRELRKRLRVEPPEEEEDKPEPEVSNVKLKVKVGYTATGAMIRPATNGNRKKKRRFRNLNGKKSPTSKSLPKPSTATTVKKSSPVAAAAVAPPPVKEDKKESLKLQQRQTKKRSKSSEPVAGPSGLQKVKRSPRRVLKRKSALGGQSEEEDDDEDSEYMYTSIYAPKEEGIKETDGEHNTPTDETRNSQPSDNSQCANPPSDASDVNDSQVANSSVQSDLSEPTVPVNGLPSETEHVNGHDNHDEPPASQGPQQETPTTTTEGPMQVVVIGDSVEDLHNYAKPPSL